MKLRTGLLGLGATVGLSLFVWAHDEKDMKNMPARVSSPEFNQLKQLSGKWKGQQIHSAANPMPEEVTTEFKVTSAGSAIHETLMAGTPHEMIDMYTDENGKLTMTHYCASGNQPHMLLKRSDSKSLTFEMGATPGINPAKDTHMHSVTLEFKDPDHLTEKWVSYQNGKPEEPVVFNMARVR